MRKHDEEERCYPVTESEKAHVPRSGRIIGACAILVASSFGSYGFYRVFMWAMSILGIK